ncbi:MAG: hemerythrin domain-containing protein [Rhodospirillaceae bacterium]
MRVTVALLGEHGLFYALIEQVSHATKNAPDDVPALTRALARALATHAEVEEATLFPALRPHLGPLGPIGVMEAEHRQIEEIVKRIAATDDPAQLRRYVDLLIEVCIDHFAKEEGILFHLAVRFLDDGELNRLGDSWAEFRHVNLQPLGCAA